MAEIESYQCDFIENEIVPASELDDFLENNTVISYEVYTGQDIPEESEEEPEEESEEEPEEESEEEPGS